MRLLLDECVPRPLKHELRGHDVSTVAEQGWSSKRNRELLRLMLAEGFEGFLTVDQNLEFQQNVAASGVAVVVVVARTNRLTIKTCAVKRASYISRGERGSKPKLDDPLKLPVPERIELAIGTRHDYHDRRRS